MPKTWCLLQKRPCCFRGGSNEFEDQGLALRHVGVHFVLLTLPFVPGHPPEKVSVALASYREGWLRSRDRAFSPGPKQGEQEQGKDTSASSPPDSPVLPEDRSRMQAPGTPVCARAARSAVPCLPAPSRAAPVLAHLPAGRRVALSSRGHHRPHVLGRQRQAPLRRANARAWGRR